MIKTKQETTMLRPCPDLEQPILSLLRTGPMLQKDIVAALPMDRYVDVGPAMRDLERRGIVTREKRGSTYMVVLREDDT